MSKFFPPKISKSRLGFLFLLISLLNFSSQLIPAKALAQDQQARAYAIKASFIYNFTRFIQWPKHSSFSEEIRNYNVCVIGDNPFGSILHRLAKKHKFKEPSLEIKLDVSPGDIKGCQILFISFSEESNIERIVNQAREWPILILGDTPGFAERGVDINLLIVENRVTFEINKAGLEGRGFRVSSELLELATLIRGEGRQ
jgi:hypothetical protein